MDRDTFCEHLTSAVDAAVGFARLYVYNKLPDSRVFWMYPNQSYDGNPLVADEETYPGDTQPDDQPIQVSTAEEAVNYLWRASKVPEWVDINVEREDGEHTYIRLLCCGRFTAMDERLYHRDGGIPPFSIKSPDLPPGYELDSQTEDQRFDLNWPEERKRHNKRLHRTGDPLVLRSLRSIKSLLAGR